MEWVVSSLVVLAAALLCALAVLARRHQVLEASQRDLLVRLERLQCEVIEQRTKLEVRDRSGAPQKGGGPLHDPLALIEQVSDLGMMRDAASLESAVHQVSGLPAGVSSDFFEADDTMLAISRLIKQGNSLTEIATRLNLPLGEVELLANTRS